MVAATASKPAEKPTEMEVEKSPAEKEEEKRNLIVQDVKGQIKEIEKAVFAKEPRIISKVSIFILINLLNVYWIFFIQLPGALKTKLQVLRQLPRTRREVTDEILVKVIQPLNIERKGILLNFLGCKDSEKADVKSVVVEGKFRFIRSKHTYILNVTLKYKLYCITYTV